MAEAETTAAEELEEDIVRPGLRPWIWMPALTALLAALVIFAGRHTFVA